MGSAKIGSLKVYESLYDLLSQDSFCVINVPLWKEVALVILEVFIGNWQLFLTPTNMVYANLCTPFVQQQKTSGIINAFSRKAISGSLPHVGKCVLCRLDGIETILIVGNQRPRRSILYDTAQNSKAGMNSTSCEDPRKIKVCKRIFLKINMKPVHWRCKEGWLGLVRRDSTGVFAIPGKNYLVYIVWDSNAVNWCRCVIGFRRSSNTTTNNKWHWRKGNSLRSRNQPSSSNRIIV